MIKRQHCGIACHISLATVRDNQLISCSYTAHWWLNHIHLQYNLISTLQEWLNPNSNNHTHAHGHTEPKSHKMSLYGCSWSNPCVTMSVKFRKVSQTLYLYQLFPSPCWSDLVNALCQEVYFLLEQEKVSCNLSCVAEMQEAHCKKYCCLANCFVTIIV